MAASSQPLNTNATDISHTSELNISIQSVNKVLTSITHAQLRVHAASDELKILHAAEGQLEKLCHEGRAALRYRRNQLTLINRLPDDILLMVFVFAKNDKIPWEMLRYIHLTWICRRWRSLAVESPVLWSLIDLAYTKHADFLEEILRRSKSIKLSVGHLGPKGYSSHCGPMGWVDSRYGPREERIRKEYAFFKKHISPTLSRVQTLELKLPISLWLDALPFLRNISVSIRRCRFRELTQRNTYYRDASFDAVDPTQPEHRQNFTYFYSKVFDAPGLEVLDIQFDRLYLVKTTKPPQAPSLRHLVLERTDRKSTSCFPALKELLLILESCCKELETLSLFILPPSTGTSLLHPRIMAPKLRTITLHSHADTEVLEYLSTPVLEQLVIDGNNISHTSLISNCLDLAALHHMKIRGEFIIGFKSVQRDGQEVSSGKMTLQVNLPRDFPDPILGPGLGLQLSEWAGFLHSITLSSPIQNQTLEIPKFALKNAHNLREITMDDGFISLLFFLEDVSICPNLEFLVYNFYHNHSGEKPPGQELASLARSRRKGGAGLKGLILNSNQPLTKRHSESISKWVGKFTASSERRTH